MTPRTRPLPLAHVADAAHPGHAGHAGHPGHAARAGHRSRAGRLAATLAGLACLATVSACADDASTEPEGNPSMSQSQTSPETNAAALETTAPQGPTVCDFVPRSSATTVLGAEDVDATGEVRRDGKRLVFADCKATPTGASDPQLFVHVEDLRGAARDIFERGLADPDRTPLPDEVGLGYSWTDPEGFRATSTGAVSETWLLRGDALVQVSLWSPPEGRDGEADTTAIAQQVTQTLDLGEEWTLEGAPPAR